MPEFTVGPGGVPPGRQTESQQTTGGVTILVQGLEQVTRSAGRIVRRNQDTPVLPTPSAVDPVQQQGAAAPASKSVPVPVVLPMWTADP
jgi:hypothetical protein